MTAIQKFNVVLKLLKSGILTQEQFELALEDTKEDAIKAGKTKGWNTLIKMFMNEGVHIPENLRTIK